MQRTVFNSCSASIIMRTSIFSIFQKGVYTNKLTKLVRFLFTTRILKAQYRHMLFEMKEVSV